GHACQLVDDVRFRVGAGDLLPAGAVPVHDQGRDRYRRVLAGDVVTHRPDVAAGGGGHASEFAATPKTRVGAWLLGPAGSVPVQGQGLDGAAVGDGAHRPGVAGGNLVNGGELDEFTWVGARCLEPAGA